jgi:hypothetical protein
MKKAAFAAFSLISISSLSSWICSLRQVLEIIIPFGMSWLGQIVRSKGLDKILAVAERPLRMTSFAIG